MGRETTEVKKTKDKDILYSNEFLDIEMINPNYPFMQMKKRGVVIIPYDKYSNVYLLKKYRYGVGTYFEVPRGFVENSESYEVGAIRELLEETGMEKIKIEPLGTVQPDTGVINNSVKMYALLVSARDNYEHYDHSDKELCKVVKLSLEEVDKLIIEGKIVCSYTMSGIYACKVRGIL